MFKKCASNLLSEVFKITCWALQIFSAWSQTHTDFSKNNSNIFEDHVQTGRPQRACEGDALVVLSMYLFPFKKCAI